MTIKGTVKYAINVQGVSVIYVSYRVLERVGPRQLAAHVRTLCDFLVLEFSNSAGGQHVTKYVETMNSIIWVYNIVPIDRLMLCLVSIYISIY